MQFVACRAEAHQEQSCTSARRCDREQWVRMWITKSLIWGDTSLIETNGGGWPLPFTSTDLPFTKTLMGLWFLLTGAFACVLPWEPGEKVNRFSVVEHHSRSLMVVAPGLVGHVEVELGNMLMEEQRRRYAFGWLCCPRQTNSVYYNNGFFPCGMTSHNYCMLQECYVLETL